jgi:8-oxo-dGTP diphosphatase
MPYTYEYPRPAVTADILLLRKENDDYEVLLIQRLNEPFKGFWALPGGFMDIDETTEEAACRELQEETGIKNIQLEQFKVYDTVGRDPRTRTVTVVYWAIIENEELDINANDDAADIGWFSLNNLPLLAFDHIKVIDDVKIKLRIKNQCRLVKPEGL